MTGETSSQFFMLKIVGWFLAGLVLGIILSIFAVSLVSSHEPSQILEDFSYLAAVVGGLSIAFAAQTYFRDKSKDEKEAVADQIHMFRVDVLNAGNSLREKLTTIHRNRGENPRPVPSITLIEEFTIEWLAKNKRDDFLVQNEELSLLGDEWGTYTTDILNALEELSVRIKLHNTIGKDDLICIKKPLVEMVEQLVTAMITVSNGDPKMYLALKWVYFAWYKHKDVDRTSSQLVQQRNTEAMNANSGSA